MAEDKAPVWARYAPIIVGSGFLIYAYYIKKETALKAATWAALAGIAASLPWLYYNRSVMPAASAASATDTTATTATAGSVPASDVNTMNKAGRELAVNYIIGQEAKRTVDNHILNIPTPPNQLPKSYETLTNDELKALYLVYQFAEHKDEFKQYGTVSDDALAKKIAKERFGINADSIPNVRELSNIALVKAGQFQLLKDPAISSIKISRI